MPIDTVRINRVIQKLGIEPRKSAHHVAGWLVVDGQRVLALHYPRGLDVLPAVWLQRLRDEMHLTDPEFAALVKCIHVEDVA